MSRFRAAIERRDIDAAVALLADDVVFRSPVVFREYRGPAQVAPLVHAVAEVFSDFAYTHECRSADGRTESLHFQARAGSHEVEGCDLVTWNQDGSISELVVLVRPLSGLIVLAERMQAVMSSAAGLA
ncbi:nuclear transport factor 2 family protein [Nocardioides sp. GXZ039]|uniref:nuclear transport factor 2 family protein n=1 Tax=Nocardioides sp. GXZ039 TaxID=3136018 RepID=UPI0030F381D7